jgi:hypothetical protein
MLLIRFERRDNTYNPSTSSTYFPFRFWAAGSTREHQEVYLNPLQKHLFAIKYELCNFFCRWWELIESFEWQCPELEVGTYITYNNAYS